MTDDDSAAARTTAILRDVLLVDPPAPDADLVDGGLVDSAGFMELIAAVEDEFGITVEARDLELDHFRTIEAIAAFVQAKQRGGRAARP